jgi:hypothetical protein
MEADCFFLTDNAREISMPENNVIPKCAYIITRLRLYACYALAGAAKGTLWNAKHGRRDFSFVYAVQDCFGGRGFRWAGGNGAAFAVVGGKISAAGKTISRIVISQRIAASMLTAWALLVGGGECRFFRLQKCEILHRFILPVLLLE